MAFLANSWLFRAEAMRLDWSRVLERQIEELRRSHSEYTDKLMPTDEQWEQAKRRSRDVHLTWACSPRLGVPRGAFTVWAKRPNDKLSRVKHSFDLDSIDAGGPLALWGGVEAAVLDVSWAPIDPGQPSRLSLHRASGDKRDLVAAVSMPAGSGNPTTVRVRCSGATSARVDNGTIIAIRIRTLEDVVNDPEWERIELVGLPCEQSWPTTGYNTDPQGFVHDLKAPRDAAVDRLVRGAPPIGWGAVTAAGRIAPPWQPADPDLLVKEVQTDLLPELEPIYQPGVREFTQRFIEEQRSVAGPTQDGRMSSLDTSATIRPFSLLALPAQTDPLLNLATGFGTTYTVETKLPFDGWPDIGESLDFMITADYSRIPPPRRGKGTYAAYAPQTGPHTMVAPATAMETERSGLVGPVRPDEPWRESVRVSWDALPTTVSFGRVTGGVLARYDVSSPAAECLAPPRAAGGFRPLALSPDGPEGQPGHDRVAFADGAADIPIGSGGRQVGYATTLVDVHGVWSPWRDAGYTGDEPAPQSPRLVSMSLDSVFAGNPSACPAELHVEVALNWSERTPASLEVVALFHPMASASAGPPPGLDPSLPTPAGCFRRDLGLTFAGDTPVPSGCTVSSLSPDGDTVVLPGPGQGDGGRRYALVAPIPTLDWGTTQRWGVQLWARSNLVVGASPTPFVPDAAHPARAVAASPVPVTPLPPPAPPGVPLGSTVDAQGCSHVRVHWSLPGGSAVRTSIVWEVSETALRRHAGLKPSAPETDSPGVRLAALWAAYDAMPEAKRRAAFRRVKEVDGSTTSLDVTLPKGSTDIHLFTATTQSMTGIESPWPGSGTGDPHIHLQAAIGPRLRRPTAPLVRSEVNDDGSVTLRLFSASRIPVASFLVYATRSEAAARDRESMGPAVVTVAATQSGTDPVMGSPMYVATWTGSLAAAWDPWFVRAVAKPVDTIPVEGVRGVTSPASDIATVLALPTTPPDLDVLTAEIWGGDHRGVVVRSSTSAPPRLTSSGSHRIGGVAGGAAVPVVALESLDETPLTTAPAAATTAPVFERGVRATGRSPLALWFTRPVAADTVDVTVRLIDPLGRPTERTITVPGYVPPPSFTISIASLVARPGGVLAAMESDASTAVAAGIVLHVRALKRRIFGPIFTPIAASGGERPLPPFPPIPLPPRPPVGPVIGPVVGPVVGPIDIGPLRPPIGFPLVVVASEDFALADIPTGLPFFPNDGRIHVIRVKGGVGTRRYAVWIPATAPLTLEVAVTSPEGQTASARSSV